MLRNDGHRLAPPVAYRVGRQSRSVTAADLDGNGNADLITANRGDNTVSVLAGNGRGTFTPAATAATGEDPTSVTTADLDGDGRPEIVTADRSADSASVVRIGS
ncbi:FG-GAP repeat domain-containing protein [Streptomyces sp. NPDC086989]|uniref:FG-GAP repeat domain-containing protein n=1 Tax=Streptomyces sp. NPDC086989 TaxID=3365764 RepID=UPI0037FB9812